MSFGGFLQRKMMSLRTDFPVWRFMASHGGRTEELFERLPAMDGERPGAGSDIILFCGADKGYVTRFAVPFATSVARASGSAAVHLHLFGEPDAEIEKIAGDISRILGASRFTMSHERCDLSGRSRRRRIMYYEVVRFARLLEIAQTTNVPLLAMDIDVLFLKTVADLRAICAGADLAITLRPREYNPAKKVRAALVYFGATLTARAFLRRAVERMLVNLFHGPDDEYPDQRALARTIESAKDILLTALPTTVLSSESEEAIVFSGRGKVKDDILPAVYARRFKDHVGA